MARTLTALTLGFTLVAAACSSSGASNRTPVSSSTSTSSAAPETTASTGPPAASEVALSSSWKVVAVGRGAKPVLALDRTGRPAVAYMLESRDGFVAFSAQADEWAEQTVAEGYFYGPIGLAFDPDDTPHIVYHDHQDLQFDENLGDLTHAVSADGSWTLDAAEDDGHDGWDSTVAIAPDGTVHAAGVDPAQFGSTVGVEHYVLGPGGWTVEPIGSGAVEYEWNVSLAVKADGTPAMTFFDSNSQDLRYAELVDDIWTIEAVATAGDVGRFSSLAFDAAGTPHISFYEMDTPTTGTVHYATKVGAEWQVEVVGDLGAVFIDFAGARRITSLAVGPDGAPRVAFSDEVSVFFASRSDAGWTVEEIATAGDLPLGQLVSLAIDDEGTPHLALFEVTDKSPVDGTVVYLTPES